MRRCRGSRSGFGSRQHPAHPHAPAVPRHDVRQPCGRRTVLSDGRSRAPPVRPAPDVTASWDSESMAAANLRLVTIPLPVHDQQVERSTASAVGFAEAVRVVATVARQGRLVVPVFRSPPRRQGVDRTIRRRATASGVVSVRLGDRPLAAVRSDVIEGVVVANGLEGERADRFRRSAWEAIDGRSPVPRRPGTAA